MDAISSITRVIGTAVLGVVLVVNVGCTNISTWKPSKMFSLDSTWPFRDKDKPHEGVPVKIVGTWTDTVMTQAGQKPQRGFGGRIMFYEKDEKNPILVDGQLIVYAFDETDRDPTDNKPTRRYVFPAEQVPIHMSKSELGASYSFWLPWDEAGGPETKVGLICRFEPKGGAVLMSEQTKHVLPGTMPVAGAKGAKKLPKVPEGVPSKPRVQTLESLQTKRNEDRRAQLASYEVPVATSIAAAAAAQEPNALDTRHMTSTTIDLPKNYQMPNAEFASNGLMQPIVTNGQQTIPAQQFLPQAPIQRTNSPTPTLYNQPAVAPTTGVQPAQVAPTVGQLPPGFNTIQFPQPPMMYQTQPSLMQQQLAQQQQLQQQAMQQRMLANQPVTQIPVTKAPMQTAATAVNSQATVLYR